MREEGGGGALGTFQQLVYIIELCRNTEGKFGEARDKLKLNQRVIGICCMQKIELQARDRSLSRSPSIFS